MRDDPPHSRKAEPWRPPSTRYRSAKQRRADVVESLALSFVDGPWTARWMSLRAAYDFGLDADSWLLAVANSATGGYPRRPDPTSEGAWRRFVVDIGVWFDTALAETGTTNAQSTEIERRILDARKSTRTSTDDLTGYRWGLPEIETASALAEILNVDDRSLLWFADPKSLERTARDENLRHYNYYWIPKRRGGARLVEAPKQNLATMQRWLLRQILDHIPTHDAAHGFVKGRSIQSFAAPHTGRDWLLRMDVKDFFPSVSGGRVAAIFGSAGYPTEVARLLGALLTNSTPSAVLGSSGHHLAVTLRDHLRSPHLPQGAPTSPVLANLTAFGLDVRLTALAERFEARYTRYADDIAFSGNASSGQRASRREVDRLTETARLIMTEEGFSPHPAKTRVRRSHQRQVLTGMVVNTHLNLHRTDLDRLRAELHEAVVKGPSQANRRGHPQYRSHLQGRLGFVQATNPAKARKLWMLFDQIDWSG